MKPELRTTKLDKNSGPNLVSEASKPWQSLIPHSEPMADLTNGLLNSFLLCLTWSPSHCSRKLPPVHQHWETTWNLSTPRHYILLLLNSHRKIPKNIILVKLGLYILSIQCVYLLVHQGSTGEYQDESPGFLNWDCVLARLTEINFFTVLHRCRLVFLISESQSSQPPGNNLFWWTNSW